MKENLVPTKVKLLPKVGGGIQWPEFNQIPPPLRGNYPKAAHFIDALGIGWHYDKVENMGKGHSHGTACTMVPADFAEAAEMLFPDTVEIISEEEFETFYDDRCTVNQPVEALDTDVLQGIAARVQLEKEMGIEPSEEIKELRRRAMDPEDERPGIRKNLKRKWKDAKDQYKARVKEGFKRKTETNTRRESRRAELRKRRKE